MKDEYSEGQFRTPFCDPKVINWNLKCFPQWLIYSFWGESKVSWLQTQSGMNGEEPQRRTVGESGRKNSPNMSGRPERTVPSIDNAINRHSCFQPSWLILKCHSGHSGIQPQYPRGNRDGIRMGPRTDRCAAQRLFHQTRRVGEKNLDLGGYTLSLWC